MGVVNCRVMVPLANAVQLPALISRVWVVPPSADVLGTEEGTTGLVYKNGVVGLAGAGVGCVHTSVSAIAVIVVATGNGLPFTSARRNVKLPEQPCDGKVLGPVLNYRTSSMPNGSLVKKVVYSQ